MSQACCYSPNSEGEVPEGPQGRKNAEDYRIDDSAWDCEPLTTCKTLYAIGGAYGNPEAMKTVLAMAREEETYPLIIYNGDMHWFDCTADNFALIEELARDGIPLSGNVELELARETDSEVGCGCSYPLSVSNAFVSRSNQIHERMKTVIRDNTQLVSLLVDRPTIAVIEVAGRRVALTHGDEKLVAGWGCSYESLGDKARQQELDDWLTRHSIKVLATTHTCAPAAIALPHGAVINNGTSGLIDGIDQDFEDALLGGFEVCASQ